MKLQRSLFLSMLAIFILPALMSAQIASGGNYILEQSVLANGTAQQSGGDYDVAGTVGQSISGSQSSGGMYGLHSGFWQSVFLPTSASVSVLGHVTRSNGVRVGRARVVFVAPTGTIRSALTNPFGIFAIDGLVAGNTYIVYVEKKGFSFAPIALLVTENINGLELVMLDQGIR
jgi:hypothetical protein